MWALGSFDKSRCVREEFLHWGNFSKGRHLEMWFCRNIITALSILTYIDIVYVLSVLMLPSNARRALSIYLTSMGYSTRWPGRLPPSSSMYPWQVSASFIFVIWKRKLFTYIQMVTSFLSFILKKKTVHFQIVTSQFSMHFPLTNALQASVCGDIWKVCIYTLHNHINITSIIRP